MVRYRRPERRSEDIEDRRGEHSAASLSAYRRNTSNREAPAKKSGRGATVSSARRQTEKPDQKRKVRLQGNDRGY